MKNAIFTISTADVEEISDFAELASLDGSVIVMYGYMKYPVKGQRDSNIKVVGILSKDGNAYNILGSEYKHREGGNYAILGGSYTQSSITKTFRARLTKSNFNVRKPQYVSNTSTANSVKKVLGVE